MHAVIFFAVVGSIGGLLIWIARPWEDARTRPKRRQTVEDALETIDWKAKSIYRGNSPGPRSR